jgi:L-asparagine transporter-like permease
MAAITFDTLKFSRKLESFGFSAAQAGGTAEALGDVMAEAMAGVERVTKYDLKAETQDLELRLTRLIYTVAMAQTIFLVGAMVAVAKLL